MLIALGMGATQNGALKSQLQHFGAFKAAAPPNAVINQKLKLHFLVACFLLNSSGHEDTGNATLRILIRRSTWLSQMY